MESEPDPAPDHIMVQFMLIAILTLINAFFSSAEMAIVSLNKNKIKVLAEEGNKKAQLLIKFLDEPTRFLSTIQVGITLAGFFSSAFAAEGISHKLSGVLENLNMPYSDEISLIVITVCLSYISLVFGELFPKRIALQKSETVAMFAIVPILYTSKILAPFIKLLSLSTNGLVSLTGFNKYKTEDKVSEEEIKSLVKAGQENGTINENEKKMINSVFEFNDKIAKEIMIPRRNSVFIDINEPISEFLNELLEKKFSRVPVYEDDIDNIIGVLNIKDFIIEAHKRGFENVNIRAILHTPYFVQESKRADKLFHEMQLAKQHMAIIIDEYGGFSGIVTMEDLVEEIVGDIKDEYDNNDADIRKLDDSTYLVKGILSLEEVNKAFKLKLESENYDTIGGFLIDIMGTIPKENEKRTIEYRNIIFDIEEVKQRHIEKIKISLKDRVLENC